MLMFCCYYLPVFSRIGNSVAKSNIPKVGFRNLHRHLKIEAIKVNCDQKFRYVSVRVGLKKQTSSINKRNDKMKKLFFRNFTFDVQSATNSLTQHKSVTFLRMLSKVRRCYPQKHTHSCMYVYICQHLLIQIIGVASLWDISYIFFWILTMFRTNYANDTLTHASPKD